MIALILSLTLGAGEEWPVAATVRLETPKIERPIPAQKVPKRLPAGPLHSHRCPYDGTVWAHGDSSFGNRAAHTCPLCGRVVWQVHQRNVAAGPGVSNVSFPRPDTDGWVTPHTVVAEPCPPGQH